MKKLLFLIGFAAWCATAAAQNEAVWGIRAGVSFPNMSISAVNEDGNKTNLNLKTKTSFNVGVSYQQPLLKNTPLFLETGLYLSGRGAKVKTMDLVGGDIEGMMSLNMLYVQLPVAFSWHFNLGGVSLQPLVGVYYGLGISGKGKIDNINKELNLFKSTSVEGAEISQPFKRSELGMRFGLNVVVKKHYMIGANYDMGLTNIIKDKEVSRLAKGRNHSFNVTLGYNF